MASIVNAKGNRFEHECVDKLRDLGFKDVKSAWGSNGLALGYTEDVDVLADGIKIQCKVRRATPKWLELGNCDMVFFKQDRGDIFVIQKLEDVFDGK